MGVSGIEIRQPTDDELEELDVRKWGIWTKEPSTFAWHYDQRETCYVLEGKVTVRTEQGEVTFGEGDLVTFPEGLSCEWEVREPIRKHYRFG